jgi:hypothetical protein
MSSRQVHGVLALSTLLKLAFFGGLFFGLLTMLTGFALYGERYELGAFIAQPFFFSLGLCFVALVGYLPYRFLARRRKLRMHVISYSSD